MAGGFTATSCWSVELADGRRVFVKFASTDDSIVGNRVEARVLRAAKGALTPELIAVSDDATVLVTEDLSAADWMPRDFSGEFWSAVGSVSSLEGPDDLFQAHQGSGREWWSQVMADRRFAQAMGVDAGWLALVGPSLIEASLAADTRGNRLLHGDLAPGNWCYQAAPGWRFVDWASAHRGNPLVDDAIASVRVTRVLGTVAVSPRVEDRPEFLALVGGRLASELLDVDWSAAPARARSDRIEDIRASLLLASSLLHLPAPE